MVSKGRDKNVPEAMDHLAYAYATGKGVALDYQEALRFYRRAADKGLAAAQFDIGTMYEMVAAFPRTTRGLSLVPKGSAARVGAAEYKLGWFCLDGRGTKKDRAEALRWYAKQANMESLRGC